MKGDNIITVVGRLGSDPQQTGAVCTLNVAVDSYRRRRDAAPSDRNQYETNWFRVVVFQKRADIYATAIGFRKGDRVKASGSCEIAKWMKSETGFDGKQQSYERVSVEIHAEALEAAPWQGRDGGGPPTGGGGSRPSAPAQAPAPAAGASFFEDDSDIPF